VPGRVQEAIERATPEVWATILIHLATCILGVTVLVEDVAELPQSTICISAADLIRRKTATQSGVTEHSALAILFKATLNAVLDKGVTVGLRSSTVSLLLTTNTTVLCVADLTRTMRIIDTADTSPRSGIANRLLPSTVTVISAGDAAISL